jgi:hypothetical protein
MGEHPVNGDRSPGTEDENARLELPSLRLPRLGRRRKARDAEDDPPSPTEPVAQPEPAPQRARVPDLEAARHTDGAPVTDPRELYDRDEEPAPRLPFALPSPPARIAAMLAGAVVGAVGVALSYLSLQGCNAVRGTKSCGGGPGLLLLIVILVVMALLGGVLLALWAVPEPRSTSLLGVGVLAVVVLLGVLPQEYSVWMFLVVPVICAASYLLAHWVTTAFVELPEKGPQHDIR